MILDELGYLPFAQTGGQLQPQTVDEFIAASIERQFSATNDAREFLQEQLGQLRQRLEAKNCVKRDRSRYVHRFSAKVTQTAVAGRHLEMLAKKVADGSLAPFITHLVHAKKLSAEERQEIRRLLEECGATEEELDEIASDVKGEISDAVQFAEDSPPADEYLPYVTKEG